VKRARAWKLAAAAAAALLLGGAAVAVQGSVALSQPARACAKVTPRPDRELIDRCARVEGIVLHVRRESAETHLAVVARLHLFVVKLDDGAHPPSTGSRWSAVGPLVRARNGMRELQAGAPR
jgi:hypothetical protein